jgi:hypothetical protein
MLLRKAGALMSQDLWVGEERDVVLAAVQVRPPPRFQCAARELMFTLRRIVSLVHNL